MGRPYMKVCLVKTKSTYALFTKKKKKKVMLRCMKIVTIFCK